MVLSLNCPKALFIGFLFVSNASHADTLLINRIQQKQDEGMPARGESMTQVEKLFGLPIHKLPSVGGDTPKQPIINRWEYEQFIVYFEHDRVIDSVIKRANPNEIGPKKAP